MKTFEQFFCEVIREKTDLQMKSDEKLIAGAHMLFDPEPYKRLLLEAVERYTNYKVDLAFKEIKL